MSKHRHKWVQGWVKSPFGKIQHCKCKCGRRKSKLGDAIAYWNHGDPMGPSRWVTIAKKSKGNHN